MESWRSELQSKNRKKIAATIASPNENSEIFSEGWEEALEREKNINVGSVASEYFLLELLI